MFRRPRTVIASLFVLALAAPACDKGGDTNTPGGKGGSEGGGGEQAQSGMMLEYPAQAFSLATDMKMALEVSGMGNGSLELEVKGSLEAAPEGDKLRITSTVAEVANFAASGDMAPEDGPENPQESLIGLQSWTIASLRGEEDEEATKALAENKARKDELDKKVEAAREKGEQYQPTLAETLGGSPIELPDLPDVGLEEGQTIKVPTENDERPLGGDSVPVEVDREYTMKAIDDSSGQRIATIDFASEGSGAKEFSGQEGNVLVSYEEETEGRLVFNLDTKLPVSLVVEQASAINFGERSVEQFVEFEIEFEAK